MYVVWIATSGDMKSIHNRARSVHHESRAQHGCQTGFPAQLEPRAGARTETWTKMFLGGAHFAAATCGPQAPALGAAGQGKHHRGLDINNKIWSIETYFGPAESQYADLAVG
jgi:hypothetical protein